MVKQRKRRQYGTGSVFQRSSDGRWIGVIQTGFTGTGGRRTVRVSATTEAECKRRLERRRADLVDEGVAEQDPNITVKAWSEMWLATTQRKIRPSTWATNRGAVRKWINPVIGHKMLRRLTPADVRAVHVGQSTAGGADNSVLRTHTAMRKMLKDAVADGHVVPSRVIQVENPQPGVQRRDAIPVDQMLALVRAAGDLPDGARWVVALFTGMRQAECLGLTWEQVDLDANLIEVSWQLKPLPYRDKNDRSAGFRVPAGYEHVQIDRAQHLVRPKSKAGFRLVPMIPPVAAALTAAKPEDTTGLVWVRANGRPHSANADRLAWQKLQVAAGVARPDGTPWDLHEARHGLATVLLEMGVDPKVVTAILGHTSITTSRGYQHVSMELARREMARVAERFALPG